MWTDNKKAISEVTKILGQLDEASLNKIPKQLLNELEKYSTVDVDYIKPNISLENLPLEKETKELLAIISYNYFCNNTEKKIWNNELKENERKFQEKHKNTFDSEHIFNNSKITKKGNFNSTESNEQIALVKYNESIFKKFLNIITKFLKIDKKATLK